MSVSILDRLRGVRTPAVGDKVWYAPKGIGGIVTETNSDGSFVFQGGEIVKNKRGREVPRWTVAATYKTERETRAICERQGLDFARTWARSTQWNAQLGMWVVGQGPVPHIARGQVVSPKPVMMSGQARGSHARKA